MSLQSYCCVSPRMMTDCAEYCADQGCEGGDDSGSDEQGDGDDPAGSDDAGREAVESFVHFNE